MKIDPAPRDIGRLVDDALVLFRANFKPAISGSMAILFPVLLLAGVAGGAYYTTVVESMFGDLSRAFSTSTNYAQPDEAFVVMAVFQVLFYVLIPVRLVAEIWMASSIFRSTPDWMAERPQTTREFLASGKARVIQMGVVEVGTWLATQVASSVVGVVFGIVVFAIFAIFAMGGAVGAVIGFVLAILLGLVAFTVYLWVMGRIQLWGPAAVIEESGIGLALSRSINLTKPHAWRTVFYWMTVGMVSYAFRMALLAPATLVLVSTVLPFIQDPVSSSLAMPLWVTMLLGVSAAFAEVFVIPFERACWAQYYLDIRSRSEGMDLVLRAQELAAARR